MTANERERIEREATLIVYELPPDRDPVKSIIDLVLRERAAALDRAARVASNTICATHIDTGIVIYGNKAADAIRALAAQEHAHAGEGGGEQ